MWFLWFYVGLVLCGVLMGVGFLLVLVVLISLKLLCLVVMCIWLKFLLRICLYGRWWLVISYMCLFGCSVFVVMVMNCWLMLGWLVWDGVWNGGLVMMKLYWFLMLVVILC